MAGVIPSPTPLAGGRAPRCGTEAGGRRDADAAVDVVVTVRPRGTSRGLGWVNRQAWWAPAHRIRLTREQCMQSFGAADYDLATVRASLASWGLECALEDSSDRLVHATGSAALMERAFGVTIERHNGHRGRSGAITLPPRLVGVARAVTGLDTCTTLRPYVERAASSRAAVSREHVEAAWGLPAYLLGEGACVAITAPAELDPAALLAAGLPQGIGVYGASPGRGASPAWDDATVAQVLAVQLAAPSARVIVHTGRGGESGAIEVLTAAIHDSVNAPQVVLVGWGAPEASWSPQAMLALEQRFLAAAAMGVTVVCAAPSGEAAFPASAPHALACAPLAAGSRTVASAPSAIFPAPAWQDAERARVSGTRRLPDVLAPDVVRLARRGAVAGAGIAAAACAGVLATLGEAAGAPLGYAQPLLLGDCGEVARGEPDVGALIRRFDTAVPPPPAQISADHRAHPPAILVRRDG